MKNRLRKQQLVFRVVLLLFVAFGVGMFGGCGKNSSVSAEELEKICGTWVKVSGDMTTTYIINADGTFSDTAVTTGAFPLQITYNGTYTYDGKKITFQQEDGYEYSFGVSFDGTTLVFDNNGYQNRYDRR